MSKVHSWQGYLIQEAAGCYSISSPWQLNGKAVFGYDSDYTTMAISLIRYLSIELSLPQICNIDNQIVEQIVYAATGIETVNEGWTVSCNSDASLDLYQNKSAPKIGFENHMKEINPDMHHSIVNAWIEESHEKNISQGAYVSQQQYNESLASRLSLLAQRHNKLIWPQRQMDVTGQDIGESKAYIKPFGTITSWTKLSAAGAPSEFAIRAPILGGVSTVMVSTTDGPNGVFLLADDEERTPEIGKSVELVVRRLYAQEGTIRYGAKAIIR